MGAQTLTEVAVEVHADLRKLKPETVAAARAAGADAGDALGDGITKNAESRVRDDKGRMEGAGKSVGAKVAKGAAAGFDGTFAKVAATMAARFALVGGAAAAAAPGIAQFVGALAPAAGAALALPAALLSIKAASAVVKIAVEGVGDAIKAGFGDDPKKAAKALEALNGNARIFAKQVIAMKGPVTDLRTVISDRFFLPLLGDIRPLATAYLPMLRQQLGDMAGVLGGLGEKIAQTAQRGIVMDAVRKLFDQTSNAVVRLRDAVDPLATIFATLISDTVGEFPKMATGFASLADRVAAFVTQASQSGKITQAFRNGVQVLKDFGGILGNIGSIIGSVYSAANARGNTLLANLRDLTGQAADFFRSAQAGSALTGVFNTLAEFGKAMRTSLGAVLPAIAQSIEVIAPALAGLAGPASQIVVALAPLLPLVAGLAATVIRGLTPAIAALAGWLAKNETAVKLIAGALVAYVSILKISAAVTTVQAAGGMIKWLKATTLATNATKVMTAVQYALGAAMRFALGPVGLIITAVGLLVAGVIYAWKHHEGFRKVVLAVWDGIKRAVAAVVEWFTGTALPWMKKVWDGIRQGAVRMWANGIRPAVQAMVAFFKNVIAPTAMWLWRNVLRPAFNGIAAIAKVAWAVIRLAIAIVVAYLRNVVAPTYLWLWRNIVKPVFNGIVTVIRGAISVVRTIIGGIVSYFRNVVGPVYMWLWKNVVRPAFDGIRTVISNVWNKGVKPVLSAMGGFIKGTVAGAFRTGVSAITKAWNGLREAARKPIEFVVNKVINPLIGGFNKVAGVFGTPKIDPIPGFARGGRPGFDGRIPGPGSPVDDRRGSLVDRSGKLLGAITVASGEFIVNARDTARALPLLKWINAGMKGGPGAVAQRLGRPLADKPGDGSEGWAFAKGGLTGFLSDVWGAMSNPGKLITKPINALLGKIPGSGLLRQVLVGMGKKLTDGLVSFLGGGGTGTIAAGGSLGRAMSFIRAQAGKPYIWASAGPRGYDCSGIVSAAWNILHGRSPHSHTFSTGSLPGKFFPKPGFGGPLIAGWSHPGQRGASAGTGHMAGMFAGGMKFESRGSRGVIVGPAANHPSHFAHVGHFAHGGLAKIARADFGSVTLARGNNLIYNGLGRQEKLIDPTVHNADPTRLHPSDIEALGQVIGRVVAAAVGAGNYAAGRQVGLYTRAG